MHQKTIEYQDGNQKLVGEFFYHADKKSLPGIIVFHAFEGRSEFTLNYGKKLAEKGYQVLVADMYGDAKTASSLDECLALMAPFKKDRELTRRRALQAYHTLLAQDGVNREKTGAMGFCFGGMCALEIARSGEAVKAVIALHAALEKSSLPTHPIKSAILLLQGYADPMVPSDASLKAFAAEMQEAHTQDWTFTFYGNAKHSFTDPKTGTFDAEREQQLGRVYDAVAANRSVRYVNDFFEEHLPR